MKAVSKVTAAGAKIGRKKYVEPVISPLELREGLPDIADMLQVTPVPLVADYLRKWPLFGPLDMNGIPMNSGFDVCLKVTADGRVIAWMEGGTAIAKQELALHVQDFRQFIVELAGAARAGMDKDIFYTGRWMHPLETDKGWFRVCVAYAASADTLEVLPTARINWP